MVVFARLGEVNGGAGPLDDGPGKLAQVVPGADTEHQEQPAVNQGRPEVAEVAFFPVRAVGIEAITGACQLFAQPGAGPLKVERGGAPGKASAVPGPAADSGQIVQQPGEQGEEQTDIVAEEQVRRHGKRQANMGNSAEDERAGDYEEQEKDIRGVEDKTDEFRVFLHKQSHFPLVASGRNFHNA